MAASVSVNDAGDLVYVRLVRAAIAETRAFGEQLLVDFDADGGVIGAECIGVERASDLRGLPEVSGWGGAAVGRVGRLGDCSGA